MTARGQSGARPGGWRREAVPLGLRPWILALIDSSRKITFETGGFMMEEKTGTFNSLTSVIA